VIARLHGMHPPPVETARVLQIGGGDGLDAMALAAAFPRGDFVNFDIAAQPIARGRRWSEAAKLSNIRHEVLDILEAADRLAGQFDYIIAHGIYAWVPDPVRAAVMPLIRRLLSPSGVAFVSYNCFPGAHSRIALREMMLHHVSHLTGPAERLAAVRTLLRSFAEAQPKDEPITAAMRREAAAALTQSDGLLFHDILNVFYAPQSLTATVHDAQLNQLKYLGEASGGGLDKGFVDADRTAIGEASLLHRLQAMDYAKGRYFRASLFVRAEAEFSRAPVDTAVHTMWVRTEAKETQEAVFNIGSRSMRVGDARRAALLRSLSGSHPRWVFVPDVAVDADMLAALRHYALEGVVELSSTPPPFSAFAPDRPRASALARMQVAQNMRTVVTLDHRLIEFADEPLRRLLLLLDGTRDRAALRDGWAGGSAAPPLDQALDLIAAKALLISDTPRSDG
jgi:hypothetical protein